MDSYKLERLRKQAARQFKLRKDPRFQRVIEVLQSYGLLFSRKAPLPRASFRKITFDDINFASGLERRISEVLPALALRHPSAIADLENMPEDLKAILKEVREGKAKTPFQGIPPTSYMRWINEFRRANSNDRQIRVNFRFSLDDKSRMDSLKKKLKLKSSSEVVRKALIELVKQTRA